MAPNLNYENGSSTNTSNDSFIYIDGSGVYDGNSVGFSVDKKRGIAPQLYFKYIKKKFKPLQLLKLTARLKKVEKAFEKAIENGQDALAEKFLKELARETKESEIYAKGIKFFIDKGDLDKHKHNIRGGHISDTKLKDFTRVIPKNVLNKKKQVEEVFDDFIIYHYWNDSQEDVKTMDREEKAKMKDPVLFGTIKETNKLYFIADWEDEYCDLTFSEIIDVIGKDDEEHTINARKIEL